jgi:transposase InsO family protein
MKQMAIVLIDEATAAGARQHKACEVLGITARTLRRWRGADSLHDQRKGAPRTCPHALTDKEKETIVATCNLPQYQSLPPGQIVPRLADEGVWFASESSFYRVLAEHDQCHRRGRAKPPRNVAKPKALVAAIANQVWSWDITYLPTAVRGQFYRLYLVLDIYSRKIVGWEVHGEELAIHAAALIDKTCQRERIAKDQLVLHADNGSPMKGATMLATLQKLGVVPSFSRPSVSDYDPYSEALFRTLKYTPGWPKQPFQSLEEARQWVQTFVSWYNTEHRHSGIRLVTPQQRHQGADKAILTARTNVYEQAKANHPNRWRGRAVRNWTPVENVLLNPDRVSPAAAAPERLAA